MTADCRQPTADTVIGDRSSVIEGIRHEARVDFPKGDPKNPMTPKELVAKFHALTGRILPEPSRSLLIERCLTLDKLDNIQGLLEGVDLNPVRS